MRSGQRVASRPQSNRSKNFNINDSLELLKRSSSRQNTALAELGSMLRYDRLDADDILSTAEFLHDSPMFRELLTKLCSLNKIDELSGVIEFAAYIYEAGRLAK